MNDWNDAFAGGASARAHADAAWSADGPDLHEKKTKASPARFKLTPFDELQPTTRLDYLINTVSH
jgi:hypothetical protein